MSSTKSLITIKNCNIENSKGIVIKDFSWTIKEGESWLIIGRNGSGKAEILKALSNTKGYKIVPSLQNIKEEQSLYSNPFIDSNEIVSLEVAASLIQEERENDESEYIEGGVDIGRTGLKFLSEVVKDEELNIEEREEVTLCGIRKILNRGLKYMSTGEIRRTLLCRALLAKKELLILSDPFAGLDKESRTILLDFFSKMASKNTPLLILSMERYNEIPDGITHVLEIKNKEVSYEGNRENYERLLKQREEDEKQTKEDEHKAFSETLDETLKESNIVKLTSSELKDNEKTSEPLVEMHNVNVAWGDNHVLKDFNWTLRRGEHTLIRGPNGSGKTTLLELITGDNMQVFCNDIKIFGNKRGSGESIWDIKKKLGIVSYRLHVEYRMLSGTSIRNVIISGFRDSIGLYGSPTDLEIASSNKWLKLGGFEGRENNNFGSLSYGEQRAILILRSAVKTPEILILDEPCHGLDENYRTKILTLMDKVAMAGTTTLLHVTHDPTEVLECEKHIVELCPNENPMYRIITK